MTFQEQQRGTASTFSNHLKAFRTQRDLSQGELAVRAGVTRQAISAIESNLYLPAMAVALRLLAVLDCHVDDLFSFAPAENLLEGSLIGDLLQTGTSTHPIRVKVATVRKRTIVRSVADLEEHLPYTVSADGYVSETCNRQSGARVRIKLSRDRETIQREISVAGCDPAICLVGEHLRRHKDRTTVVGRTMGSTDALQALNHGEVHIVGIHLLDLTTGKSNLPTLRRSCNGLCYDVVTCAT